MILAGYSYGSLVLARLPPVAKVIERFEEGTIGTSPAEIILRARTLAKQTLTMFRTSPVSEDRGRTTLSPEDAGMNVEKRTKASSIFIGGEETNPRSRRDSRDSRRSVEVVRDPPKRFFGHMRTGSGSPQLLPRSAELAPPVSGETLASQVQVRYLVISPVVIPFTTQLCPPGPPSLSSWTRKTGREGAAVTFLQFPTLAIFGTTDAFTSKARLRAWAEKQTELAKGGCFAWEQMEGVDHFWRGEEMLKALHDRIAVWLEQ